MAKYFKKLAKEVKEDFNLQVFVGGCLALIAVIAHWIIIGG